MNLFPRYDRELVMALRPFLIDWNDLSATRARGKGMLISMPDAPSVAKEDRTIPGPPTAPAVPIRIYRPVQSRGELPGLLWMHGGGMVLGTLLQDDLMAQHLVEEVGCVIVSVEYRLAPEHPYPAPLDDCYVALTRMATHAAELAIDPARIAVGGMSAGGGLAAGLALLARDRGEVPVAFQLLIYPMIDDRDVTASSETFANAPMWSRQDDQQGWRAYLGEAVGGPNVSPYAAPSRATDLTNLPPTYIAVGSQEVFLDESVEYAQRLAHAGIPVEVHVYPRAFHAWDATVPRAALSQRFVLDRDQALKRALSPASSRLPL